MLRHAAYYIRHNPQFFQLMHSITYFNAVYKEQKTWFLYPVRDVILYKQYTLYPIRYELDVVNNICHRYFKNCDTPRHKFSKLL